MGRVDHKKSQRVLSGLCVSAVNLLLVPVHRGDAENAEVTQRGNSLRMLCASGAVLLLFLILISFGTSDSHSQSGRQKAPNTNSNSNANNNTRPRQAAKTAPQPTAKQTSAKPNSNDASSEDTDEVIRVSSHLVPVPASVVDARGVAIANLRLEDFELSIDGQPKPISDITRAESPVRMAMLFDNSGSLDASRDFEKHAAVRFFRNVMRPADQAA